MSSSPLKALAELILSNVNALEKSCEERGVAVPSLDGPFIPGTDIMNADPMVVKKINDINSAASQLMNMIRPAPANVLAAVSGQVIAAALRCAIEFNVAEILRPAGPAGLHVKDIASKCNTDANKLGSVLRALTSQWIFKEVQPDVFANNRLSSILDKGQELSVLTNGTPEEKYANPRSSIAAILGRFTDEGSKAASFLYEMLSDKETAFSSEPTASAFCKAFKTDKSAWEWLDEAEQHERRVRFGVGMEGVARTGPQGLASKAFDWNAIPEGGKIVDVGGGIGAISIELAKAAPKLKFVVQDRAAAVEDGRKRLEGSDSELLKSNRIVFQAHSFFDEQPIKDASVFFLKHVFHDWSDAYALKILRRLRDAATPSTRLFVLDRIIPYNCFSNASDSKTLEVPGVLKPSVTPPLTNVSGGNSSPFVASLIMTMFFNGQERTLGGTVDLYREGGWKIVRVRQFDPFGQFDSGIEAVPV
ncbi:S-adenosyl-L-methionine-dependent methyltransferase [Schizopora paradoxa]|uniref:S-adenosyl-L-methionine-dependent methyltransferase n=1 Tax=Schizopora paradoxa TaxID=27342 RepID=A0A0H2RE17_9AGAM|nr:S-adenosyl-L-methionine-dependent methyltransferase [Schizopora paradoxa]